MSAALAERLRPVQDELAELERDHRQRARPKNPARPSTCKGDDRAAGVTTQKSGARPTLQRASAWR